MLNQYDPNSAPSPAQVQALREIYRRLVGNDRWPTFDEVDRALDRVGIDLEEIARNLPAGLTNLGPRPLMGNDELILHPEALPFCAPDSDDDRQLIQRIVWLAIEADRSYNPAPGDQNTARLTGDELSQALGYPEARLYHLYHLLTYDYWFGGGSYNPDDHSFEFRIRRQIRKYRGVQSYADYLRVRQELRNPPVSVRRAETPKEKSNSLATPSIQATANDRNQYEVALSFAGEDRLYVAQVADALKRANISVFYDDYERADLWGKDLASHLDTIYRKLSRFVVMFVSTHYSAKVWTNLERRSALARAIREKGEFILPARFDDTDLPGLPDTIAYIDCRNTTPAALADLITQKLSQSISSSPPETMPDTGQSRLEMVGDKSEPLITSRLEQTPGSRPTAVVIRNLGDGPALNCVYVAVLTDSLGLVAWYMTPPIDLDAHETRELQFSAPHGIEQIEFTTYDESSATPAGQRLRRYFTIYTRAFDNDPRADNKHWSSRALIGQTTPPNALFQTTTGTSSLMPERHEVMIYFCTNNHLHRSLPHTYFSPERFDVADTFHTWIEWYRSEALRSTPPPNDTSAPKPNPRFLRDEPV